MTFFDWIKKNKKRDDSIGDFCKDSFDDDKRPRGNNFSKWEKHLQEMHACDDAMKAFYNAFAEYKISCLDV